MCHGINVKNMIGPKKCKGPNWTYGQTLEAFVYFSPIFNSSFSFLFKYFLLVYKSVSKTFLFLNRGVFRKLTFLNLIYLFVS